MHKGRESGERGSTAQKEYKRAITTNSEKANGTFFFFTQKFQHPAS